jgi:hypothetical protein
MLELRSSARLVVMAAALMISAVAGGNTFPRARHILHTFCSGM